MNINNNKYVERFNDNLKLYNAENNTNYTFHEVQTLFIDVKQKPQINNNMQCMCGHPIKECYEIINPDTGHTMILGNSCINTYMINAKMRCIDCGEKFKLLNNKTAYCKNCIRVNKNCKVCNTKMTIKKSKKSIIDTCLECIIDYQKEREKQRHV